MSIESLTIDLKCPAKGRIVRHFCKSHIASPRLVECMMPAIKRTQRSSFAFLRPVLYRVQRSDYPVHPEGGVRARQHDTTLLDQIEYWELREHVWNHAGLSNMEPTPFISVTNDLMRALSQALRTSHDDPNVYIICICPWLLIPGSYIPCSQLRERLDLQEPEKYATEYLVWQEIPEQSIVCRLRVSDLLSSKLLDVFPSLGTSQKDLGVEELRLLLMNDFQHLNDESPRIAAEAFVLLGMNPSSSQARQTFTFLVDQANGTKVWKEYVRIDGYPVDSYPNKNWRLMELFDMAAYELAISYAKGKRPIS
ncbi:hypothetical protein M426DRAFT_96114 [Hypoxylon sp. CI-4A]|nr:hypothetical protein M426DRAFT_96114 [Hypoxylon sp. CI-4A]